MMSADGGMTAGGATLLTEAPPAALQAQAQSIAQHNGADAAVTQAQNTPEWVVPKFWNPEKAKDPTFLEEYAKNVSTGYRNAEQLIGRADRGVIPPTSEDDVEGWNRVYDAFGRPEKPDDYELERPALPEDLPYDEEGEKFLRQWAHSNGLNKKQTKSLYNDYAALQVERQNAYKQYQQQAKAEAMAAFQRQHGPLVEREVQSARTVMSQYADPDFKKYLDETGLGNDPRMLNFMARVGKDVVGETKLKGRPVDTAQPADLDVAIANFSKQHEKALWDKDHPEHNLRLRERAELFNRRWPSQ